MSYILPAVYVFSIDDESSYGSTIALAIIFPIVVILMMLIILFYFKVRPWEHKQTCEIITFFFAHSFTEGQTDIL